MAGAMMPRLLVVAVLLGACTHQVQPPAPRIGERPPVAEPPAVVPPPTVLAAPTAAPVPSAAPQISPASPAASARVVEFARDIRPILEARCQPCHFPGGRMYEKLPFDRPETIHQLGTRLFTRVKAEDEQRLITEFLAQPH